MIYSFFSKHKTQIQIVAILFLYLCSNSFIVDEIGRWWENYPVPKLQKTYEVGIVLGGIGRIDPTEQRIEFTNSADRLLKAIELYHQRKIKKILITGGSGSVLHPEDKEAIYIYRYLKNIQVPDTDIIIENESRNTYENAIYSKKILDSLHIYDDIILITSAYHLRRSVAIFKKVGYQNILPYPAERLSGPRKFEIDHCLLPHPDAMSTLYKYIHEWAGIMVYKMKGYAE
ncbi:MAG: YdcF family protein [Bacteroidia bacterium]|nr:YdcF family protein [Bacteroidia bacterium]